MAQYHYDEAGSMAAYFVLTFLSLILIPLTLSFRPSASKSNLSGGCKCTPCLEHRERIRRENRPSLLKPKLSTKALITIGLWILFALTTYKIATTTVKSEIYDPYSILGIKPGVAEKEIKRLYKKLSLKFHPDKVKLEGNQTIEEASSHFVDLTKAYKSLTDETIRKNLEMYGHPDGKQEYSVGIAIPKWIVESKNNIWILGLYGLIFGGGLPALVGRWWFGARQYTKDGVKGRTAAQFFKSVNEDSDIVDLVRNMARAWEWESHMPSAVANTAHRSAAEKLEKAVQEKVALPVGKGLEKDSERAKLAVALLYAHLARLEVQDTALRQEQTALVLQTQPLLSSLLAIALSHNWLAPTLNVMHLYAHLAQAHIPGTHPLTQLPALSAEELDEISTIPSQHGLNGVGKLLHQLEEKGDRTVAVVRRVGESWGRLEVVDVGFKVLGERIITPGSIVQLVFKLRISPPVHPDSHPNGSAPGAGESEQAKKFNEERDAAFLLGRKDAEDLPKGDLGSGWAHAPYWPTNRKPQWWALIGDTKVNRVIAPPTRFSDVPYDDPSKMRNYRAYKLTFQAPTAVGAYTWRVYFVSDTFVGEDCWKDLTLKVEDLTALNADEQAREDEISDPEEDSLAGQMAAMRGGPVKRLPNDSDDDESGTDDDEASSSSSSDSD